MLSRAALRTLATTSWPPATSGACASRRGSAGRRSAHPLRVSPFLLPPAACSRRTPSARAPLAVPTGTSPPARSPPPHAPHDAPPVRTTSPPRWVGAFILKQQYDEGEQAELLDRAEQARTDTAYAAALEYTGVDPSEADYGTQAAALARFEAAREQAAVATAGTVVLLHPSQWSFFLLSIGGCQPINRMPNGTGAGCGG